MKQKNGLNWNSPLLKWETWNEELVTIGEPLKGNCYPFVYRRFPDRDRDGKKCFIHVFEIETGVLYTEFIFISPDTLYGKLESWDYETFVGGYDDTALNGEITEFVGKELVNNGKVERGGEDAPKKFVFHGPGECRICTGLLIEAKKT
jgi:hypothetical protein